MLSWGKSFIFKSKPFDWNDTTYYHQLSDDFSFVPKYNEKNEVYEEFDTLAHVTNFESLREIFEDGRLKYQFVKDSSVCNPERTLYDLNDEKARVGMHPLARSKIVWYGPYTKQRAADQMESVERYGNIMLNLRILHGYEGILDTFNYYLVEVIHYKTKTATRILVTRKKYDYLMKYNPHVEGGPWYYDRENKKNWCLTKSIHFQTKTVVKNSVEFMRDESLDDYITRVWLENHMLSYKTCDNPRSGVRVAKDTYESVLRLILGTMAYKLMQREFTKMPHCTKFVELSANEYSEIQNVLGYFRSRYVSNQDVHKDVPPVGIVAQEDAKHGTTGVEIGNQEDDKISFSGVNNCLQQDSQSCTSGVGDGDQHYTDGAYTLLETMLRSTYGDIGSQLLKMKEMLGNKASFLNVSPAEVTDKLLTFFRQEFFKLGKPLEIIFDEIKQFIGPNGIVTFFDDLERRIDKSITRKGNE